MFRPEDFELPLEKQLRLRVIDKEVDECSNTDELKQQLKQCVRSLMNYQHLLGKAVEANLMNEITKWETKVEEDRI